MPKLDPAMIDDENPEWTDEMFARAQPAREVLGDAVVDALMKRQRGRPRKATLKARVTLRLDPEIVEHFKAGGKGWQSRMNEALARAMKTSA